MGKAILAFVVTVVAGIVFASIGTAMHWVELGNLFAIAVMGAFIIYFNDKENKA